MYYSFITNRMGQSIKIAVLELLVIIGSFITPISGMLLAVGFAIGLDTIMGYFKARKKNEQSSRDMRMGLIPKSIVYSFCIFGVYSLDMYVLDKTVQNVLPFHLFCTKLIAVVLIYIEATSINENFKDLKGKSITESFADMVKAIKKFINSITVFKK